MKDTGKKKNTLEDTGKNCLFPQKSNLQILVYKQALDYLPHTIHTLSHWKVQWVCRDTLDNDHALNTSSEVCLPQLCQVIVLESAKNVSSKIKMSIASRFGY